MLPSGSTMTLRMLTPFFPFRLDCCGASGEGAETASGGVAHGGGFVGLHTLGSGSEALAAVNASAIDKAPLHISGAILKNGYLMSKLRQPSRILHDWRNIRIALIDLRSLVQVHLVLLMRPGSRLQRMATVGLPSLITHFGACFASIVQAAFFFYSEFHIP